MSLSTQIADYEVQKKAKVPKDILEVMEQTTEQLVASHIANKALKVGDKVSNFSLPDQHGEMTQLSDFLKTGPVVISFYRGGWCPYCNLELKALNDLLPEFHAQNTKLLAISPQLPDSSLDTAQKNELEFKVLSDLQNKVADQFGLVFDLDERLKPIYDNFDLDLQKSNGDDSYRLPLPATYVINQQSVICYAFACEDYTKRAEPQDVLNSIKELKNETF